ncbi:MAG: DEAD/DEAH box helicase family protein, partial [Eubacteriales bacterium]
GKKVQVYNKKESEIAEECQKKIQGAFEDWIWESPERRESLSKLYNEIFNAIRPREFDGSHIRFEGMTDKIELNQHQKDAVARTLYGGNTMLAHCVGAGKTFTMISSAMEGKRLGLHNKSLIIVPNHLTSQVGADVYKLYPNAKVLVAGSDDFSKDKRREVCSRIATGNYDIVVLGHTQFEKIPLSPERVEKTIRQQVAEITKAIKSAKQSDGESFTVKNLEKKKRELEGKIKTLLNEEAKDDVVHFEDLGIDKLYVDEAHKFKNLFLASKMTNVSGINSSFSQRATDLLTKCQYLDEITGGKGVVFATGTPISNSMTELFTMMKYLQSKLLESMNLQHFDSWASSFCLKITDKQLTAAGDYKEKTRFAKFFNLPEVVTMWKEGTDIQTKDMLDLPTPEFKYETLTNDPTPYQKWYINELSERADDVEMKLVEKEVDSMGIITMDGRRIALDPRLEDERLPDEAGSKINVCINKVAEIWEETAEKNSTQMIFLDQGVPHFDGTFNLYDDIRDKLVEKGIPKEQVAFIHEAKKDEDKDKLFAKVRSGEVRVLIGSTEKMGAGTNCQNKLIALHHLDIPWKPSEEEQTK